jgi:hypothetical protein
MYSVRRRSFSAAVNLRGLLMQIQTFSGHVTRVPAIPSNSRLDVRPFEAWHRVDPAGGSTMAFIDIEGQMTWREISAALSVEQCHASLEVAAGVSKFVMMTGQDDGLRAPRGAVNLFPYIDEHGEMGILNACFPNSTRPFFSLGINADHFWHYADESDVLDVLYWDGTRIHIAG